MKQLKWTERNEQAGFKKGRSCMEQTFVLRNIIEQSAEWRRQLYGNFLDFEKAFYSIYRDSLWCIMRAYGIPNHMVQLTKSFWSLAEARYTGIRWMIFSTLWRSRFCWWCSATLSHQSAYAGQDRENWVNTVPKLTIRSARRNQKLWTWTLQYKLQLKSQSPLYQKLHVPGQHHHTRQPK